VASAPFLTISRKLSPLSRNLWTFTFRVLHMLNRKPTGQVIETTVLIQAYHISSCIDDTNGGVGSITSTMELELCSDFASYPDSLQVVADTLGSP
jgi:hypothetical protein